MIDDKLTDNEKNKIVPIQKSNNHHRIMRKQTLRHPIPKKRYYETMNVVIYNMKLNGYHGHKRWHWMESIKTGEKGGHKINVALS